MPGRRGRCAIHCCGSTWAPTPPPSTTGRRSLSSATWHARTATAGCAASASRAWPSPSIPLVTRHRAQRQAGLSGRGHTRMRSPCVRPRRSPPCSSSPSPRRHAPRRSFSTSCPPARTDSCQRARSRQARTRPPAGTTSTSRSVARWWLVPCHGRTVPRSSKWCRSDHEAIGGRMTVGGSCLCGDVAFELVPGDWMGHCHCSMCRKAHGAAFATHVSTEATAFRWLRGAERVRRYESSPGAFRPFCERCGSKVPEPPASGQVLVPAGLLDDDPQIRPRMHIFVASKAPWHEIADSLPRFDAYPPGAGGAVPFSRRSEPAPGVARGSCVCGRVAYEIADRVPGPIANCHCSRCRKGRSAAHASNLFVELARFRWLRGEGLLVSYKVPEAQRFTQVFCRTCGASAPRVDAERGRVVVPAGSLRSEERRVGKEGRSLWW